MPFSGVSEAVKKHPNLKKYSKKGQSAWVKSFNSAYESKHDEAYAFSTAYSVANRIGSKTKVACELLRVAQMLLDLKR